jgi:hypothetical protein
VEGLNIEGVFPYLRNAVYMITGLAGPPCCGGDPLGGREILMKAHVEQRMRIIRQYLDNFYIASGSIEHIAWKYPEHV